LWQGNATSHFAIYTDAANNSAARDILTRLETARIFFAKTGLAITAPQLNILAFESAKDADIYRVNPSAYAFYQRTREGDFVVMRDLTAEHYPVAVHEYTHFVLEHAGLKLPLWLNEGLADFYSTVESRTAQVLLGAAPSGRENALSTQRWIDWSAFAGVDHDSPYYRQADKMLLFYAQSWAMVHMLALDSAYEPGFKTFLLTVSAGASTESAMQTVYRKSLEQIGADLQSYVGSKRMAAHLLDIDIRPMSLEAETVGDAGKRVELALAEILAASPQLAQEANTRLASLATKYPDDPRPEESLGFQAMRANRLPEAEEHFALAVRHNSKNPEVWFRLAHLKLQSKGPSAEAVDLLERVVAVDGAHYGARLELGFAAAKNEKYELAVRALQGLHNVKPEHAYAVSYTLAYCLAAMQQGNQARMYAEQARQMANSSKDRNEVAGLLRYIEQETPAVVASR
jgi:Flp pilus assembly protein TadD